MTLEELLAGNRGRWVIASLLRDIKRVRRESGYEPPHFAREVLTAIDRAAEADSDTRSAASGIAAATVATPDGRWVTVREGAAAVQLTERRVRQLVGGPRPAVSSRRLDGRTRLVDLDSLKSVCARQKENR